jgi:hypothetical protein
MIPVGDPPAVGLAANIARRAGLGAARRSALSHAMDN